jgi:hypothetical protein
MSHGVAERNSERARARVAHKQLLKMCVGEWIFGYVLIAVQNYEAPPALLSVVSALSQLITA